MGRLGDLMQPGGNQLRGQSAFCMLHPALGGRLDYPDVAGLAAPKPMLFLSGARTGTSRRRWPKRRSATCGGSGGLPALASALDTAITDGAHVFTLAQQARAVAFLERALAPGAAAG